MCSLWTSAGPANGSGRSAVVADKHGFRLATDADPAPTAHLAGTLLPGFRDAHVHLGLVDGAALVKAGIAAVDDFGWDLDVARGWPDDATLPSVRFAGRLLTAPGGYPSDSGWAPEGAIETVASSAQAAAAVDRQLDAGANFIKITLNSDAGPVLDDPTLHAIVGHAHARGVTVAAHAQGVGQAERAYLVGIDRLAHAPWSEPLGEELLTAMARRQSWVSTLDVHGWGDYGPEFEIAQDNIRRFAALGGRVVYGTDLGNGPLPLGINPRELRALTDAGLGPDALVAAIAGTDPAAKAAVANDGVADHGLGSRVSYIARDRTADTAGWLASASVITVDHWRDSSHDRIDRMLQELSARAAALDAADPLGHYRDLFIGSDDPSVVAYLDGNSLGRPLRASVDRVSSFITKSWGGRLIRGWDEEWMSLPLRIGDALGEAALGAASGQVFVGDSTTVVLYKLIRAAIDARPGRSEIVVDTDNFPTDRYLLQGIAAERGMTLRWIESDTAAGVTPEQVAAVVGPQTALVLLSQVAYRSGFLADVPAITEIAHEAGALVLWDLCHSVGAVEVQLDAWGVDFAAGCSYKYLNGGPGAPAFGYVRAELQASVQQPIWGWLGSNEPFQMGPDYVPAEGIRRFISGTPAVVGHARHAGHDRPRRRGGHRRHPRQVDRPHRVRDRADGCHAHRVRRDHRVPSRRRAPWQPRHPAPRRLPLDHRRAVGAGGHPRFPCAERPAHRTLAAQHELHRAVRWARRRAQVAGEVSFCTAKASA